MFKILDPLRDITFFTVLLRLILAVILGAVIGIERSYKNRPAGFRTHILVCVGASIACMTGIYMYVNLHLPTDISRLGAQVVSGLGFIGGGTIIITNGTKIKGLTTAAGLWACGIIGIAIGAGFYEGGLIATVLVLVSETLFSYLGSKIPHNEKFKLLLIYTEKPALNDVMRFLKNKRMSISNLEITGKRDSTQSQYSAILTVRPRQKTDRDSLIGNINEIKGVVGVKLV